MSRTRWIVYGVLALAMIWALYALVMSGPDGPSVPHRVGATGVSDTGRAVPPPLRPLILPRADAGASLGTRQPAQVYGVVRCYRDGRPVAHTTIVFQERGGARRQVAVSSDRRGRYHARLAVGRHRLQVRAAGYTSRRDEVEIVAMEGGVASHFNITLYRLVPLRGEVVDLEGQPVVDAIVAVASAIHPVAGALATGARAKAMATGAFKLLVPPGVVTLTITTDRDRRDLGPLFVADRGALPRGVAGLRVVLGGGLTLAGRVLGPKGRQLDLVNGRVLLRDDAGTQEIPVGRDGRFVVGGLSPGRKMLQAVASGHSPSRVVSLILAAGGSSRTTLSLAPLHGVAGRVVNLGRRGVGRGVGEVRVEARPSTSSGEAVWLAGPMRARSAVDGRFTLSGVADLPLLLTALAPDGRRARRLGVVPGSRDAVLPLTLTGGVAGVVKAAEGGQGLGSFHLHVMRAGASLRDYWVISRRGSFTIDGLAQGVVRLVFRADGKVTKAIASISVIGGTHVAASVTLADGGRLIGCVRGQGGMSLADAVVTLDDAVKTHVRTDGQGRFRFEGAPRGRRFLRVDRHAYRSKEGLQAEVVPRQQRSAPTVFLVAADQRGGMKLATSGLVISQVDGAVVVVRVDTEQAAARAGVRVGDRIVALDGQAIVAQRLEKLRRALRGLPGTILALRVARGQKRNTKTIDIGVPLGR